ncbi:hypothetical protein QE422_003470 [Chryseobacterium sp. SORGH_AS 447]|uniref:hypothetical protein n=1 Tax=Chryseobacterium sp. SORGH_AS_0447 TaxID=3041769 RepID=UPI00277F73A3|nr:hypothetical protein [Chryseobacterium sp. SORGH_AS_0447]MDQ1163102.1 hypothetical protein [Chryseobacterium sp. SORGH_AS_0447]
MLNILNGRNSKEKIKSDTQNSSVLEICLVHFIFSGSSEYNLYSNLILNPFANLKADLWSTKINSHSTSCFQQIRGRINVVADLRHNVEPYYPFPSPDCRGNPFLKKKIATESGKKLKKNMNESRWTMIDE